ncbi:MAG: hypothetical protein KC994_02630, partial [Candidatus Omnitrophica bacterium]|nr:hypothetical protein [Candidatus Omnitrophota bacterium]
MNCHPVARKSRLHGRALRLDLKICLLILTALSAIGMASPSVFAQDESAAKDLFLESIERNIRVGQERQALHILNTLRSQEYQGVDSPRFLFLEI